jgi:transcriptional regulator with XRE-family HTH domain
MDSYEAARKSLAYNIRTRRKALGLSQEALALEADVNRTFVSQIERAIGNPSLHTLCRLSNRLALPCHELLLPPLLPPVLSPEKVMGTDNRCHKTGDVRND